MADLSTVTLPSGDTYNLKDSNAVPSSEKAAANGVATLDANGLIPQSQVPGMVILSYGNNTWTDFLAAYQKNNVIYCRASSNSNPATGSQTRLAFMAYVNNETNPTSVEFQYYRSVSSKSDSQQGDQVFVYTLTNTNGGTWTVTTRNTFTKVTAGTGLSGSWASGVLTLSAPDIATLNTAVDTLEDTVEDHETRIEDLEQGGGGGGGSMLTLTFTADDPVSTGNPEEATVSGLTNFSDLENGAIAKWDQSVAGFSTDFIYLYLSYYINNAREKHAFFRSSENSMISVVYELYWEDFEQKWYIEGFQQ